MKQIQLGKILPASAIALGCMRIENLSIKETAALIDTALEQKINFFDHADIYGDGESEEIFGQVLKESKGLRKELLLQTKCGICSGYYDSSKEHILESVNNSLKRLKTDYIDVLLLHRPDTLIEPESVADALEQLHRSGKVRYFGMSNCNSMQLEFIKTYLKQPLLINQLQFGAAHTCMVDSGIYTNTKQDSAIMRDGSILEYCRLKDITIQAWSPFQYGMFEGVFLGNKKFFELNKTINRLATSYGVSDSAIAAAFILRHPAKIQMITGTTNVAHLKEICNAETVYLSRQEWYQIYTSAGHILP